jgi:hypothetical protein
MKYPGKPKNSVGLKPNAEWKKDAKAPSYNVGAKLVIRYILSNMKKSNYISNNYLQVLRAL